MSEAAGNGRTQDCAGLASLGDAELTGEADRAWQRGDAARVEQVKAERERRKIEKARQRALSDVKQGGVGVCLFAGLMVLLMVLNTIQHARLVYLVPLVMPAALAGLSYYVFKGSRFAAVAAFAIVALLLAGDLYRARRPNVFLAAAEAGLVGLVWLAVRGSFALRKAGAIEGSARRSGHPSP